MTDPAILAARRAVYALARTQLDWLPRPGQHGRPSAGFVSGRDERGRELRWQTCPDCLTDDHQHRHGCETCGGAGEIPATHPQAEIPVRDGYETRDATRVGGLAGERDHERARWIDAELRTLQRTLDQREGRDAPEDWFARALRLKEEQWSRGDYRLLDQAQQLLAARLPLRHLAWMTFVVDGHELGSGSAVRARLDETADWLAERMLADLAGRAARAEAAGLRVRPVEIRVPVEHWDAEMRAEQEAAGRGRWANRAAQADRNAVVVGMFAEGRTAGEIARRVGLTKRRVQQLLAEAQISEVASGPAA